MKRKLVKQGAATLMVSIPAKWAKQHGLDKGSEVEVEEQANNLNISAKNKQENNKISIDVSGYTPVINRILLSLYIRGFDQIEVKFSDIKEIKSFQKEVINQLIGLEIIKQSNNIMLLKQITSEKENIDELTKRILSIIDGMFEELINAIKEKKDPEIVIEIDLSINKLVHFCQRVLNKQGYPNHLHETQIYMMLEQLESIGDACKNFALEIKKSQLDKKQTEILEKIRSLFNNFQNLFDNFRKEKEIVFAKQYEEIKKEIKNKNNLDHELQYLSKLIIELNNYLLILKIN